MFRELLTGTYGNQIERVWWDHYPDGCGMSSPGGFRSSCPKGAFPGAYGQVIEAVRKDAPHLLITNGPDAGNALARFSAGNGYYPVWNLCTLDSSFRAPNKVCQTYGPGLQTWQPRQTPDSLQEKHWFWHADTNMSIMTASHIWERWLMTVGGGSHYLLNIPPNSSGVIPEAYHAIAKEFGDGLRSSIGSPVAQLFNHSGSCTTPAVLNLPGDGKAVDMLQVREDVRHGQKIAKYALDAQLQNGTWTKLKVKLRPAIPNTMYKDSGSPAIQETVGHRVVDLLEEPLGKDVKAVRFRCIAVNSTGDDMPSLVAATEIDPDDNTDQADDPTHNAANDAFHVIHRDTTGQAAGNKLYNEPSDIIHAAAG